MSETKWDAFDANELVRASASNVGGYGIYGAEVALTDDGFVVNVLAPDDTGTPVTEEALGPFGALVEAMRAAEQWVDDWVGQITKAIDDQERLYARWDSQ